MIGLMHIYQFPFLQNSQSAASGVDNMQWRHDLLIKDKKRKTHPTWILFYLLFHWENQQCWTVKEVMRYIRYHEKIKKNIK